MRKVIDVTITDEGRDKGKVFTLTELSAARAEEWATKALLALAKSGVEIPDNVSGAGLAGIAVLGLKALGQMSFADLKPLMDEMFECIKIRPEAKNPNVVRSLIEDDIEEIATRLKLRSEIFTLHTGFSLAGNQSSSTSTSEAIPASSSSTQTFRRKSAR